MLERLRNAVKGPDWITIIHTARDLRTQYGDISLESGREVRRFFPESREALERLGYVIYTLTGQSMASMREADRKFMEYDYQDFSSYENLRSMHAEVAINPDELFIPYSNGNEIQQEVQIAKFAHRLRKKVNGVDAVLGEAPDYIELEFTHLDATGERLFGEKVDFHSVRSATEVHENTINWALVNISYVRSETDKGLLVNSFPGRAYYSIYAAPLVVPAK